MPTEFDVTFDFAIYLCSQKHNNKIESSKNLLKCLSLIVTFYISRFKINVENKQSGYFQTTLANTKQSLETQDRDSPYSPEKFIGFVRIVSVNDIFE